VAQASHLVELSGERTTTMATDEEMAAPSPERSNPLRPKLKAHYASQRKPQSAPPILARATTAPKAQPKRTTGRPNPLRP
jgi:hypothetical protein